MLVTEQAVARQIRDLAGQVVERHLDAYAETIVAQEIEEVVTDRSLEQVVRRAGRSVEWQVLTDPFDTSGNGSETDRRPRSRERECPSPRDTGDEKGLGDACVQSIRWCRLT